MNNIYMDKDGFNNNNFLLYIRDNSNALVVFMFEREGHRLYLWSTIARDNGYELECNGKLKIIGVDIL